MTVSTELVSGASFSCIINQSRVHCVMLLEGKENIETRCAILHNTKVNIYVMHDSFSAAQITHLHEFSSGRIEALIINCLPLHSAGWDCVFVDAN